MLTTHPVKLGYAAKLSQALGTVQFGGEVRFLPSGNRLQNKAIAKHGRVRGMLELLI